VRLRPGAHVAIIGAGPSGLTAAKHALQAGFDVTVFEASDDLGGQWDTTAPHSGVWPGMHTNTSRAMTAFSDFAAPSEYPLHPAAEQIHAYLRAYAEHFGVTERIRLHAPVSRVSTIGVVDGERFDGVIVASGRFRTATGARSSTATGRAVSRSHRISQRSRPWCPRFASPAT
jgi:dimethylaniline monooxygenase (N-oxide forming)